MHLVCELTPTKFEIPIITCIVFIHTFELHILKSLIMSNMSQQKFNSKACLIKMCCY